MTKHNRPVHEELRPFAARVRELREGAGLQQADVERALGHDPQTVAYVRWVEEARVNPGATTLLKLADALGCRVGDFFDGGTAGADVAGGGY